MVIDMLEHNALYSGLGAGIAKALDYLSKTDFTELDPGKYEIDGGNVFALVSEYSTKPRQEGKWEAHRKYIDVQYMVKGTEMFGFAQLNPDKQGPYDEQKDLMFTDADGDFVVFRAGMIIIAFPHDLHMPGLAVIKPQPVRKVVVKVRA